ncbi:hypothetical protein ASE94_01710 [Devosia sp. Leaf64]|nr:hypothetical protein ASE94_01710 [Devosia sp. Leaf64]
MLITFVENLLAFTVRGGLALITLCFFASYVRELWYFFLDRDKYNTLPKPIFRGGEETDGPVLGTVGRLLLAYPIFIVIGGLASYDSTLKVISCIYRQQP